MPETNPSITPVCRACGADAMIPDAILSSGGSTRFSVSVYSNPEARLRKQPATSEIAVTVCGECGVVEMRAAEPHTLWEAYAESLSRSWE